MSPVVLRLEQPSTLSGLGRAAWLCAALVYGAMVWLVATNSGVRLSPLPWVAVAHAASLAIITGITALLLCAHSIRSSDRGYLALAVVFGTVFMLQLAVPLVFPGAFVEGPLVGGAESSITLFYTWNAVFFAGLPVAALLMGRDRSLGLVSPVPGWAALALVLVPGLLIDVWVIALPGLAPQLTTTTGVTDLAKHLDWVLLALALVGLVVVVAATRGATAIGRWLIAVAVLGAGAAVVNVGAERFTVGWYFNRTLGLLMMSLLLVALVVEHIRLSHVAYDIASRDALTGAMSRAVFQSELDQVVPRAVGTGESLALLWIDLDSFKAVNDQFGHPAGDALLAEIARRISEDIRETDLLARMGGDEFACLLTRVNSRESVYLAARRIATHLGRPLTWGGHILESTCSVGISFLPGDAADASELLAHADQAMYRAKRCGGGRVEGPGAETPEKAELVGDSPAE
jgi:diguanylate cyclase (GGDEF)-like protein